ncbi:MAG: bifunctional (p)ppGpp synthetase/guanosine-3',5'-bis(diphosphate) 3'-pyrophosphohydrolase [Acidobacteriota bacterium]
MIRYEDLEEKISDYNPDVDFGLLRKAYVFSAREHQGQVRKGGEPYLAHPLEVANILVDLQLDIDTICVGLLHDVVEDTLTSISNIREYFGDNIADIVDGVTKISQINFASTEERQSENYRKLILAMVDDIRVVLVKLADRLHNMRTLEHLSPEKQKRISRETLDIYAPIAMRIGMARIRGELQDLAFRYIDPVAYNLLTVKLAAHHSERESFIRDVTAEIVETLKSHGVNAIIESRIKRIYSIYEKINRKDISFDQVYDLVAFRILLNSISECYTVLGLVNNKWKPVPDRIRDFIAVPRQNMYQSLHSTVIHSSGYPFEIQIRTHDMHKVAEEGIAAHWKYKEGKILDNTDDTRFKWLRDLMDMQKEVKDPLQFLSNLKIDLYPDEVYVFSPIGEVIVLPVGATALDYAYYIHTELGNKCIGAKVNKRIVPLRTVLENGNIIEILTSADALPRREWLDIAKTSRARMSIRRWLNQNEEIESVELGKTILRSILKQHNLRLRQVEKLLRKVALDKGYDGLLNLYASLGTGQNTGKEILKALEPELGISFDDENSRYKTTLGTYVEKVFDKGESSIIVSENHGLLVYRAKCCNPIKGEPILGFLTLGQGISVHYSDCPELQRLLVEPKRRVPVSWDYKTKGTEIFPAKIVLLSSNTPGLLAEIAVSISEKNANMADIKANSNHELKEARMEIVLEVRNISHLNEIVDAIRQIDGIHEVHRDRTLHERGLNNGSEQQ